MPFLASILVLAISRADLVDRFRAPVITEAEGLVQVYADCPADLRREYQLPVSKFAAATVNTLYEGLSLRPQKFTKAALIVHIGEVRTNVTDVVVNVTTNDSLAVTRLTLPAPQYADLYRFKLEIVKAFFRSVKGVELSDDEAISEYRHADPALRVEEERIRLDEWLALGKGDDEEGIRLLRRIIKPGTAFPRDVLIFASRLFLYPSQNDLAFAGRFKCLSFAEALKVSGYDPMVRIAAYFKAREMTVFGGGKGPLLQSAAEAYERFLYEFAKGEKGLDELKSLLDDADVKLNIAFEEACKNDKK